MKYQMLQRQWDLIPKTAYSKTIIIIGAGAVGSWTTLSLAKMGFGNITVFDHDEVDEVNISSQFYPISAIGKKKVVALQELVEDMTGFKVNVIPEKFTGTMLAADIVISAVDSMEVRKLVFDSCKLVDKFIDPRMGAESMLIYTFNPKTDKDKYEASWYSDSNALAEACTAKATIYCANVIAGMIAKIVKNIACNEKYPFNVQYDMKQNQFQQWVVA